MSGKLLAVIMEEKHTTIGDFSLTIEVIAFVDEFMDKDGNMIYTETLPRKTSVRSGIFYFNQWFKDEQEFQESSEKIKRYKKWKEHPQDEGINSLSTLIKFNKIDAKLANKEQENQIKKQITERQVTAPLITRMTL